MVSKKTLAVTLSALLLSTSISSGVYAAKDDRKGIEITFKDTAGLTWVKDSIGRMKSKEIFQGHNDGLFKPYASVTRIQSIITVVRLMGLEEKALQKTNVKALPFKDASSINQKYYGYLAVALETGILSTDEKVFSANKPASRVWVSELLVKALGLIEEAEQAALEAPEFKDANEMSQEEAGFVNVAAEYEIFAGTLEGFFNPEKDITRAQMAAVLDRTYGNLLEEEGAITVNGVVTEIGFTENTGSIAIKNFNGEQQVYQIPKELLVQFQTRFLTADQIRISDIVELYVENGIVIEAAIYPETAEDNLQLGIQEVKVEAELADGTKLEFAYSNKKGIEKGKFETKNRDDKEEYRDSEALALIQNYLNQWNLSPELSKESAEAAIINSFGQEVKKLEVKVKFSNGEKWEIEQDDKDHQEIEEEEHEDDGLETENE